jgi:hypothetical protein
MTLMMKMSTESSSGTNATCLIIFHSLRYVRSTPSIPLAAKQSVHSMAIIVNGGIQLSRRESCHRQSKAQHSYLVVSFYLVLKLVTRLLVFLHHLPTIEGPAIFAQVIF